MLYTMHTSTIYSVAVDNIHTATSMTIPDTVSVHTSSTH